MAVLGWQVLPSSGAGRRDSVKPAESWRNLLKIPAVRVTYAFEILSSFTGSSVAVFSLLLAMRELGWSRDHAVWLMAMQGLSFVVVLLFLGGVLLRSRWREQVYAGAHLGIMLALLLFGLAPTTWAYLLAALLLGVGLGVNNLVNTDRIARAEVDKARVSSHLTLFSMAGGSVGALAAGRLADSIGLRNVFLIWLFPWAVAWLLFHFKNLRRKQ